MGIWDRATNATVDTCAIITTEAKGIAATVHDRMPFIVSVDAYAQTLTAGALVILTEADPTDLDTIAVTTWVNRAANDDAKCLEPAEQTRIGENLTLF